MKLQVQIGGFAEGQSIPVEHTCDGDNRSPEVQWSGLPPGTQSLALIMDDPDAPSGTWNHWILWDIPARLGGLAPGHPLHSPFRAGTNDFGKIGYGGPCPPHGHGPHHYHFRLYALDAETIGVPEGARRPEVDRALARHTLARAEYSGVYERK